MKILNTKNGKFGRFMRKNGAYFVLGLVVLASSVAIYTGATRTKNPEPISSEINLSGDENEWNTSSQNIQPTDVANLSSSQSQPSHQLSSSLEQSSSLNSSEQQSNSQVSQQILFISPLNAKVLNKYSGNTPVKSKTMGDWRLHTGIDYAAEEGTSVCSSAEGIVSKIYTDSMWGTTIEIEHPNNMVSIYSSLDKKVFVEKGQNVTSGQVIGKVSNSARVESEEGSHLHFAIKKEGKFVDPESIITKPISN